MVKLELGEDGAADFAKNTDDLVVVSDDGGVGGLEIGVGGSDGGVGGEAGIGQREAKIRGNGEEAGLQGVEVAEQDETEVGAEHGGVLRGEAEGFLADLVEFVETEVTMAFFEVFADFVEEAGDDLLAEALEFGRDGIGDFVAIGGVEMDFV